MTDPITEPIDTNVVLRYPDEVTETLDGILNEVITRILRGGDPVKVRLDAASELLAFLDHYYLLTPRNYLPGIEAFHAILDPLSQTIDRVWPTGRPPEATNLEHALLLALHLGHMVLPREEITE